MKAKKKAIIIETFQLGINYMPDWFMNKVSSNDIILHMNNKNPYCIINTLEGKMRGNLGDYIIKGVQGEIYPCKKEIFDKSYDILDK